MKTIRIIFVAAIVIAIGLIIVMVLASRREAAQQAELERLRAERAAELEKVKNQARRLEAPTVPEQPLAMQAGRQPKRDLKDPEARQALSLVGADAGAEQYWIAAINDPSLPPKERQDLIEDLNEEGFADPKRLAAEDLPLILNRIKLIEQLAPFAIDEVNAAAFQEAYKDLTNMAARLR